MPRRVAIAVVDTRRYLVDVGGWAGRDALRGSSFELDVRLLCQATRKVRSAYGNVVEGLVANPPAAFNMFEFSPRLHLGYVVSAGIIGLYSRWGLLIAFIVLLPSAVNSNPDFIHFATGVQSWPAVLFLIAAYVLALQRVAGTRPSSLGALCRRNYHYRACSISIAVFGFTSRAI